MLVVCQSCFFLSVSWAIFLSDTVSDILSSGFYMLIFSLMSVYSNCLLQLSVDLFFSGQRVWFRSKLGQALLCGFQIYMLRWSVSCPHLFLVQHYSCWFCSNVSTSFMVFVATLSQLLPKKLVFPCCMFQTLEPQLFVFWDTVSSLFPYLTQRFLSQILICQFQIYFILFFWFRVCFFFFFPSSCISVQKCWLLHPSLACMTSSEDHNACMVNFTVFLF